MSGVAMLQCRAAELEQALAALSIKPTFINAYVSPHLDIDQVARTVTRRFPGCRSCCAPPPASCVRRAKASTATPAISGTGWCCSASMPR
jgi:hypothetical protein